MAKTAYRSTLDRLGCWLSAIGYSTPALAGAVYLLCRYLNYHPKSVEQQPVFNLGAPPQLSTGQTIKVVTYNVQFCAGTGYDFFYDGGPDTVVSPRDVRANLEQISKFLRKENPDFVLLQEVDRGARRTGYLDETELLREALPVELRSYTAADYWRSKFVPHPKVAGSVGTQLVVFSRYRVGRAYRYQLPLRGGNPIEQDFYFKRAILKVEIPLAGSRCFVVLNTHLEAFSRGTDIMERQVAKVLAELKSLDRQKLPWIIGGDFNLLPPGQYARLAPEARGKHTEPSAITPLFERYQGIPRLDDAIGNNLQDQFTFSRQTGTGRVPVRTLDYFFAAPNVEIERYEVRQKGTHELSDHFP
ncbi:MAG TPA: endonuclease/exonuclease/phosphatase family protein, partial [Chthoniobacterales bacterium]|nr:endonuclease/exonuclease/phosphatase family protein [Chthoniobacterales bacterium]